MITVDYDTVGERFLALLDHLADAEAEISARKTPMTELPTEPLPLRFGHRMATTARSP